MVEKGGQDFAIKKETMIKKNIHDIKEIYEMDSAVSLLFTSTETRKWVIRSGAQSYPQSEQAGESNKGHC